jgi:hypothetical protein
MVNIVLDDRSKTQGYEWSIQSWKNWADKNNCELFVLDQPIYDVSEMKPQWHKLLAFDLLDNQSIDYDQILFVDSDTIVHPNCPNFFETSENKFCGVTAVGSMDWICRSLENYSNYLFDGYTFPYWKYINSGFMIFNKSHREFFQSLKQLYYDNVEKFMELQDVKVRKGNDQTPINYWLQINDIDVNLDLPIAYNLTHMNRKEMFSYNWQLDEDKTPFFLKYGYLWRFTGMAKDQRTDLMSQLWNAIGGKYV